MHIVPELITSAMSCLFCYNDLGTPESEKLRTFQKPVFSYAPDLLPLFPLNLLGTSDKKTVIFARLQGSFILPRSNLTMSPSKNQQDLLFPTTYFRCLICVPSSLQRCLNLMRPWSLQSS